MGQARRRGDRDQRIAQAHAKIAASRPDQLVCNDCGAAVTDIHPVSTRGLAGIDSIWVGQCQCGQTTFAAAGKAEAVQAFFDALATGSELRLGSQSPDGSRHDSL